MVLKVQENVYPIQYDQMKVKNEPMVFSATPEFAWDNGGALTRRAITRVAAMVEHEEELDNMIIDTRVHMLKPDWMPSIAGWHCDAVPRDRETKKVIPDHPERKNIKHYLMIIDSGTGSLTVFPEGDTTVPDVACVPVDQEQENYWGVHSRLIDEKIRGGTLGTQSVESGRMYSFDAFDYHNAVPAKGYGFRYFFRASVNTLSTPRNEKRLQTQVYLPSANHGW